jgi:hypothetical protein
LHFVSHCKIDLIGLNKLCFLCLFIYLVCMFNSSMGILLCIAGETVTIVGDHDPALLKYFDCTRSGPRSAFDSNVVYQFEIMEYVSLFFFLYYVFYKYRIFCLSKLIIVALLKQRILFWGLVGYTRGQTNK